jgi:hypothetical protein
MKKEHAIKRHSTLVTRIFLALSRFATRLEKSRKLGEHLMILRWSHLVPFSFVLLAATAAAGTPPDGVSLVRLAAPVFGSEVVSPEQERGAPCSLLGDGPGWKCGT